MQCRYGFNDAFIGLCVMFCVNFTRVALECCKKLCFSQGSFNAEFACSPSVSALHGFL